MLMKLDGITEISLSSIRNTASVGSEPTEPTWKRTDCASQ